MGQEPRVPPEVRPVIPLLSYQRADVESAERFSWCCWSRQIGKSFTKSLRRVLRGVMRGRNQILLSAGERQSRELMLKVRQHCQALNIAASAGDPAAVVESKSRSLVLELPNHVRIIGLPANPQTARGFTGDVLLDEFAMHRDDREIWAAIFPSVLRGDGELDVASTPKGKDNLFAGLRENPKFAHSVVTLDEAIAAGLPVNAEEIRQSMNDEELYRQEFLCEFVDEASSFLTYEQISAVEDPLLDREYDIARLKACRGKLYAGMDIGRHRDLTVLWIVEARDLAADSNQAAQKDNPEGVEVGVPVVEHKVEAISRQILVTRAVRETCGEPFRSQFSALQELMSLRQVQRCCIDASGMGLPLAEAATEAFGASRIESVCFTTSVKDELASRLRMHIEEKALRIPVDAGIRNDWHSVRRSITNVGPARYLAARSTDGHADRFWAACLAVRAAGQPAGEIENLRGPLLRYARAGIW